MGYTFCQRYSHIQAYRSAGKDQGLSRSCGLAEGMVKGSTALKNK